MPQLIMPRCGERNDTYINTQGAKGMCDLAQKKKNYFVFN